MSSDGARKELIPNWTIEQNGCVLLSNKSYDIYDIYLYISVQINFFFIYL